MEPRPVQTQQHDAGNAVALLLCHANTLSDTIAEHLADAGAFDATPAEVAAVVRDCLRLATSGQDLACAESELAHLRRAGARLARDGSPIDSVHRALREGVQTGWRQCADASAEPDLDVLAELGGRLAGLMGLMSATIASAYMAELRTIVERQAAMDTLAAGLLSRRLTPGMVGACGIPVARAYFVMALATSRLSDDRTPGTRSRLPLVVALRRELENSCAGALSLFGTGQSTLLVPSQFGDTNLDRLIAPLVDIVGSPITATVIRSDTRQIADNHQLAHRLLGVVRNTDRGPGLYRFPDLILEYQLTREGPGHQLLSRLLSPLDDHPELLETLTLYVRFGFNKKRTARALSLHHNTIRNRLERVGDLVGVDPNRTRGMWRLHCALVARGAVGVPTPPPAPLDSETDLS